MKIEKTMHCIASKMFPLKFYRCGNETDELEDDVLRTYESCVDELKTYDEPEEFQILAVKVTYEVQHENGDFKKKQKGDT